MRILLVRLEFGVQRTTEKFLTDTHFQTIYEAVRIITDFSY